MVPVQYPEPRFRLKREAGREILFDPLRKKWVALTPEEWVRQNFIQFLVQVKNYPSALVAVEKEMLLGELKKRFDLLVYDPGHRPWMMIECKAMEVELDETVLQQLLRYNLGVPVEYLVITNGKQCFGWHRKDGQLAELTELPGFPAGTK